MLSRTLAQPSGSRGSANGYELWTPVSFRHGDGKPAVLRARHKRCDVKEPASEHDALPADLQRPSQPLVFSALPAFCMRPAKSS